MEIPILYLICPLDLRNYRDYGDFGKFGKFWTNEEFVGRGRGWGCVYAVYDDEEGGGECFELGQAIGA